MSLASKILFKYLSARNFKKIRRSYFSFKMKLYKPISEDEFIELLQKNMGIKQGDTLFVHSSVDGLNIGFSPFRLLDILLSIVGEEGTLLFPNWHFNYRAEDYLAQNKIFDVENSRTVLGFLPEMARLHPSAVRSLHPTNSILAIGKNANELLSQHIDDIYPCGEKSPYYKMMKFDALIIGLGVDTNYLSFVHCPEDVMREKFPYNTRTEKVYNAKVKLQDGSIKEIKTLAAHKDISHRNVPKFIKKNISKKVIKIFSKKGSDFFVAKSSPLFNDIRKLAAENKTIYNTK